jgi:hypothetical protein
MALLVCAATPRSESQELPSASIDSPSITLENGVREDATASSAWTQGIAVAIGETAAYELALEQIPLSPAATAWLQVLANALSKIESRAGELARLFDVQPINAVIVAGNRGSSDGFGWEPDHIGINLQAFADTYGLPGDAATDRMVRIVSHEYLHLLSYSFYPGHRQLRDTPIDRALWTIFFEGIGDYVSLSSRWMPADNGAYADIAAERLGVLEPILFERLEKLVTADETREAELRSGISMGRFEEKWGSLPFALWLHREVRLCGEPGTLQAALRLERDGVLLMASRHAGSEYRQRILRLQEAVGRSSIVTGGSSTECIAKLALR